MGSYKCTHLICTLKKNCLTGPMVKSGMNIGLTINPSTVLGMTILYLSECCRAKYTYTWVKVFRVIPEFRILRLTFHRKSASNSWIGRIIIGYLLGTGWPLGSCLWCLTVSLSLSHWYPGSGHSGVVLDCIDSRSLYPYLLSYLYKSV